jgi:hypothetical protein
VVGIPDTGGLQRGFVAAGCIEVLTLAAAMSVRGRRA